MPTHIMSTEGVRKHDVVMVHQTLTDKKTKEPYIWRWFGLVTTVTQAWLGVIRVGDKELEERRVYPHRHETKLMLLTEEEWPDGLHVFAMVRALEGDIDIS